MLTEVQVQQLWDAARAAQTRAYAPYSHFAVGAALLDEHGAIHAGCNVENAAFPQGWCAEASALSVFIMAGSRHVRGVLVLGTGGTWITPCGGCRQKLREFADPDTPVLSANSDTLGPAFTLEQLLPQGFGPGHLPAA